MITQTGRLLYISENAAEYLGHSMVSTYIKTKIMIYKYYEYWMDIQT